jgi:hypothetical protein
VGSVLFPTHLLVAGLLGRAGRLSAPWLVVGAALPDVVDKPLATVGLTDLFHSVGHSVLWLPVAVAVGLAGARGLAVVVGWGSHLLLDAGHVVVNGRPGDALSLAWPVAAPADPLAIPPGAFARHYVGTPSFVVEVALWLGAAAVLVGARRRTAVDDGASRP